MIAFNFTLRLEIERFPMDMGDVVLLEKASELLRDIGWTIIRQQAGAVSNLDLRDARGGQCQVERVLDISGGHASPQLSGNDVTGGVVQHGRKIRPTPSPRL